MQVATAATRAAETAASPSVQHVQVQECCRLVRAPAARVDAPQDTGCPVSGPRMGATWSACRCRERTARMGPVRSVGALAIAIAKVSPAPAAIVASQKPAARSS